jgi:nitrogen fixation protein FixH
MKRWILFATLAVQALAAAAHDNLKPAKGGVIAEGQSGYRIELVAEGGQLAAWVTDHDGKPVAAQGVKAELTMLAGSEKSTATFEPAAGHKLLARVKPVAGAKVVVRLTVGTRATEQLRLTLK